VITFEVALYLQTTVILLVGLVAGILTRRKGPAYRILVLKATLVATVLAGPMDLIFAGKAAPYAEVHEVNPKSISINTSAGESRRQEAISNAYVETWFKQKGPPNLVETSSFWPGVDWIWPGVTLALIGIVLLAQEKLRKLHRLAIPVSNQEAAGLLGHICIKAGLRTPGLLESDRISSPFLAGVLSPAIYLPTSLDEDLLRAVFAHEIAHLRQRDCAWRLFGALAGALLWPQPMIWVVFRMLRSASEELADQVAVQEFCEPYQYAQSLLDVAQSCSTPPTLAAGVVGFRSHISRRIAAIVDPRKRFPTRLSHAAGILGFAYATVIPIVALLSIAASTPRFPFKVSLISDRSVAYVNGMRVRLYYHDANGGWNIQGEPSDLASLEEFEKQDGFFLDKDHKSTMDWIWVICDFPSRSDAARLTDDVSVSLSDGSREFAHATALRYRDGPHQVIYGMGGIPSPGASENVYFATSSQPWQTVSVYYPKSGKHVGAKFVTGMIPTGDNGAVIIKLLLGYGAENRFCRVRAFDKTGQELLPFREQRDMLDSTVISMKEVMFHRLEPGSPKRATWDGRSTVYTADELPLSPADVFRVELQTRPVTWVEFKNVPLSPGP